jgi:hypothetical protein
MNEHRRLANLALHLIEGAQRDDEQADALLAEAFESHARGGGRPRVPDRVRRPGPGRREA